MSGGDMGGSENVEKIKLKPCPFCGGKDIEIGRTILPGEKIEKYNVGCPDCGVWYDWIFLSEEEAIEVWNERIG